MGDGTERAFWCSHVAQLAPFIHFGGAGGGGVGGQGATSILLVISSFCGN